MQGVGAKPYTQAYEGFKGVLGPEADITRLIISELSESDAEERIGNAEPDLVLAIGMKALRMVEDKGVAPIVYVMVLDAAGRFSDKKHITGVSMVGEPEKQLEIICRVFPDAGSIGLIYDPEQTGKLVRQILTTASGKNVSVAAREVYRPENVPPAFILIRDEIDVFWMLPDLTVMSPETARSIFLLAMESGRPVVAFSEKYAEQGALMSIGVDPYDMGRQAGRMAEKILAGADAGAISSQDARKTVVTVNTRIAEKLGVVFDKEFLDQVRIIR
ncbi:MAG: ABC transporter substrate-binding protein [Desulfobacterales bacterium]